jgi:hypothetical protein
MARSSDRIAPFCQNMLIEAEQALDMAMRTQWG